MCWDHCIKIILDRIFYELAAISVGLTKRQFLSAHCDTLTVPLLATMNLEWSIVTACISEQKQINEGADHFYTR